MAMKFRVLMDRSLSCRESRRIMETLGSFSLTATGVETDRSSEACSVPSQMEVTGELCSFLLEGVAPRPGGKSMPVVSSADIFITSWPVPGLLYGT